MNGLNEFVLDSATYVFIGFAVLLALVQYAVPPVPAFHLIFLPIFMLPIVAAFVVLAMIPEPVRFSTIAAMLVMYGVALFMFLDALMLRNLATTLTRWRGEKWVKEMDYLYLSLGSVGVIFSLSKVQVLTGRVESGDALAPLLLATAVVIRVLKTRADIAGWNKTVVTTLVPSRTFGPASISLAANQFRIGVENSSEEMGSESRSLTPFLLI